MSKTITIFKFSEKNSVLVNAIFERYPADRKKSAMLPLLDLAQRQCGGWIPPAAITHIAHLLEVDDIRVYEVASFYGMFNLKPVGKFHVQVCGTTPCWLKGSHDIIKACEKHLNVKCKNSSIIGDDEHHDSSISNTSQDGQFTLSEVECLGGCVNAPIVQINDDYYEDLTPDAIIRILDTLPKEHDLENARVNILHMANVIDTAIAKTNNSTEEKPVKKRKKTDAK